MGKTGMGTVLKKTVQNFLGDECFRLAAALAYYTLFSLPGLLLIIVFIAGALVGEEAVRGELDEQIRDVAGGEAAEQIQSVIRNVRERQEGRGAAATVGIVAFIFGATGAFVQLQRALNKIWNVEPDKERGGIKQFLIKRVLSFGMVLMLAFLMLVSLAVSAVISMIGGVAAQWLPDPAYSGLLATTNYLLSFLVIMVLFGGIFKIMPDVEIKWKSVLVGAGVTSALFVVGKEGIGYYLGQSGMIDAFGAAAALAVILLWVYYSALILFLGAEFTQAWSHRYGDTIVPSAGAVRVIKETRQLGPDEPDPDA